MLQMAPRRLELNVESRLAPEFLSLARGGRASPCRISQDQGQPELSQSTMPELLAQGWLRPAAYSLFGITPPWTVAGQEGFQDR